MRHQHEKTKSKDNADTICVCVCGIERKHRYYNLIQFLYANILSDFSIYDKYYPFSNFKCSSIGL